jgi:hypothetical protein
MSSLRVNSITNLTQDGPPLFVNGLTVASGYALTCSGGINISGVVTATSFSGDGLALTSLPGIYPGPLIAIQTVINPLPFYRH